MSYKRGNDQRASNSPRHFVIRGVIFVSTCWIWLLLSWKLRIIRLNNSYNNAEDAESRREDFNNEDFNEERLVLSVRECTRATCNSNGYTTSNVREADAASWPKYGISCKIIYRPFPISWKSRAFVFRRSNFIEQNNRQDDTVYCCSFAKNDTH